MIPLLWATGTGSDVIKPVAVPLIGGMITSTIRVLLVTPLIFLIMKRYALRRGKLHLSGLRAEQRLDQREMTAPIPTEQIILRE